MNAAATDPDLLDCLRRVLPGAPAPHSVRRLATGWSNRVFAVRVADRALIVRLSGPPGPGIDRRRELRVLEAAAAAALTPAPLHADPDRGELVLPDLGLPTLTGQHADPEQLVAVGALLGRFHALAPRAAGGFDPVADARLRLDRAAAQGLPVPPGIDAILAGLPGPRSGIRGLAHNDLNPDNLLLGARPWLLDFELAAPGDVRLDPVTLAETAGLTPAQEATLTAAAGLPLPDAELRAALGRLHHLRQFAWARHERARGNDTPAIRAQEQTAARALGLFVGKGQG